MYYSNTHYVDKLKVADGFKGDIKRIKKSTYGAKILSEILNHKGLRSLTIKTPLVSADIRKSLGLSPTARFTQKSYGTAGVDFTIIMDVNMVATIVTTTGEKINVGTDAILFHELAHVYISLNNLVNMKSADWYNQTENKASLFEGKYAGYNRNYFGEGAEQRW